MEHGCTLSAPPLYHHASNTATATAFDGATDQARDILGKVAAENHENQGMIARIQSVFAKTGHEEAGQRLLAEVGREIVEINDRGAQAERNGDHEASLQTLIGAAERIPSVQFLTEAAKAIFIRFDRKGWNEEMAERGIRYLQTAYAKDALNPKVVSAREMYLQVARKYGIEAEALGTYRGSKK